MKFRVGDRGRQERPRIGVAVAEEDLKSRRGDLSCTEMAIDDRRAELILIAIQIVATQIQSEQSKWPIPTVRYKPGER